MARSDGPSEPRELEITLGRFAGPLATAVKLSPSGLQRQWSATEGNGRSQPTRAKRP